MFRLSIFATLLFAATATAAPAAPISQGFDCPPGDEMCTCDGTYTDCNNMKVNCVDGKITCKREGDIERCWCQRVSSAIKRKAVIPRTVIKPAIKQ